MTDEQRYELSGQLFALEVLVGRLLAEEFLRSPDKGLLIQQIEADVQKGTARLPQPLGEEAKQTLSRVVVLARARAVYLEKPSGLS
jgi:hypothetical protein